MSVRHLQALPTEGLGEISPGDDLGAEIAARTTHQAGDVIAISQKAVSKAEGRLRDLDTVRPGERARQLAAELGKDPALVELILAESARIVRAERGILITETRSGHVCANAGIDSSNVAGERRVALLPSDPDASARAIKRSLEERGKAPVGVVISDSFGRPWRLGQTEVAIGCAGLVPLDDWRGRVDRNGRELAATAIGIADEVAAAADLVRDKASGHPVVVVRGLSDIVTADAGPGAAALCRPAGDDLFR